MSRSDSGRARWFGKRGGRPAPAAPAAAGGHRPGDEGADEGRPKRLLIEEYDGIRLLRTPSDDTLSNSDVLDLARALAADAHTVTVVAGVDAPQSADLWPRLGGLLDELREDGIRTVRLVMTAAGDDRPGAPALARRIADAWELEVIAPDGLALVVPGGGLFVPVRQAEPGATVGVGVPERGSWWRFRPGAEPQRIGPRQPAPGWQPAVDQLPDQVAGGCVIEQIPAGVLTRSRDAAPPRLGDLCYSVPADPGGPTVLVGVPEGEDVSAGDLVEVLSALPEAVRKQVRLAPGSPRDILRTGQWVSDALGTQVVVYTGMPLLSHGTPTHPGTVRSVLVGADGAPRWQAFVDAVMCLPAGENAPAQAPRLLRWGRLPEIHGTAGRELSEHGVVSLSEGWQAGVTRAGLWITDAAEGRPPAAARPADAEGPAIEVGRPGQSLEASLFPALGTLLSSLGVDVRSRARLFVHGTSVDGGRELRRIAAEHGLRAIRFGSALAPPQAASPHAQAAPAVLPAPSAPPAPAALPAPPALPANPANPANPAGKPESPPLPGPPPTLPTTSASTARPAASAPAGAPAPEAAAVGSAERSGRPSAPSRPRPPADPEPPVPEPASISRALTGAPDPAPEPRRAGPRPDGPAPHPEPPAPRSTEPSGPAAAPGPSPEPERAPEPSARTLGAGPSNWSRAQPPSRSVPGPGPRGPGSTGAAPDRTSSPERGVMPDPVTPLSGERPGEPPAREAPTPPTAPTRPMAPTASTAPTMPGAPTPPTPPATPTKPEAPTAPETPAAPTAPDSPAAPTAPRAVDPSGARRPAAVAADPLPPVPFLPGYVSSPAERTSFRGLAEDRWERHSSAVMRALTRMPALRGPEQEDARDDLIALHMYLHATEGPLTHGELARSLRAGEPRLLPYAACVASALRRLPSYRGLAFRGTDAADAALAPGNLLREAAPVSALPAGVGAPRPGGPQYAIWSATGRRVRELAGGPGAAGRDEVVFAPGSLLRVLDVRESDGAPLVLLREVPATPATATTSAVPQSTELDDHDRAALDRLDQALRRHPLAPGLFRWPELCEGPLGRRGDAVGTASGAAR
ncbi:hypothetical protein OHS81_15835 [Streptomyces sp. NBC_00400]|uniref:hypothetical protein n=1 Tax=Streptomyces sp. NBC_00400 TaxID=2975737 RepID=UPI002E205A60